MSRIKRKKSNRFAVALMLLMVAAAGTVALALYVKLTPADRVLPSGPETTIKGMPADPAPSSVQVQIPIASYQGDRLTFSPRQVSVAAGDPHVAAVNEFLRTSNLNDAGVRLMSIDLEDGIANLHFTEGFDSGQGSMDEATLIYGLRAVLGQFEEIQRLRIFVQGRQIEELGHFEFGDAVETIPVSRWGDPVDAPSETTDGTPPPSMPR